MLISYINAIVPGVLVANPTVTIIAKTNKQRANLNMLVMFCRLRCSYKWNLPKGDAIYTIRLHIKVGTNRSEETPRLKRFYLNPRGRNSGN